LEWHGLHEFVKYWQIKEKLKVSVAKVCSAATQNCHLITPSNGSRFFTYIPRKVRKLRQNSSGAFQIIQGYVQSYMYM